MKYKIQKIRTYTIRERDNELSQSEISINPIVARAQLSLSVKKRRYKTTIKKE